MEDGTTARGTSENVPPNVGTLVSQLELCTIYLLLDCTMMMLKTHTGRGPVFCEWKYVFNCTYGNP
jgi:hypothetical protein